MTNKECEACGKQFVQTWPGPGRFCSRSCRNDSMRTIKPSSCPTCGKTVRRKRYCSPQCYHASLRGKPSNNPSTRILLPCQHCGTEMRVKAYREAEFKYCSRKCYLAVHTADNVTPEFKRIRGCAAYAVWRTAVFKRDDYTCQGCGQRGGELRADHIKTFAHHPELRFELSNGRTLCDPCHRATPTYGVKAWRELGAGVI